MNREKIKILLVEDNPGDARLVREMLTETNGGTAELECEEMLASGLERLASERFDVVLLDLTLPDSQGLETLHRVHTFRQKLPVVVLTGLEDDETAQKALENGAQDYLVKGKIIADSLGRSIRYALGRYSAEEALRRREAYYHALIEHTLDCITLLDGNGIILYESPSITPLLGYSQEELVGRSVFDFIHPEDIPAAVEALMEGIKASEGPSEQQLEVRFKHMDGSWRTFWGLGGNHLDDPEVHGIILNSRDITDRKHAEEELRKLTADLEHRVEERTRQLEAANRELEAFNYSVSHDLRAPLRIIEGFSRMLMERGAGHLDEEFQRQIETIRGQATQMEELIDDLLTLSKMRQHEVRAANVDMKELALAVWDEVGSLIEGREVNFTVEDLPPAWCDRLLVHQIFTNLLSNSIKFTGKKESSFIKVAGMRNDWENVYSVTDNGVGFDMQYVDKLFGVFQRLHSQDEFEGTGVGLALVKHVVERQGGRVWAQGAPGEGATFYFILPAAGQENP